MKAHSDTIRAIAFCPDGKTLATASNDRTVKLWSVAGLREIRMLPKQDRPVLSVAFSPDGKVLATGTGNFVKGNPKGANLGVVKLWNVPSGTQIRNLEKRFRHHAVSIAATPDGNLLAACDSNESVSLWDVASGTIRRTLWDTRQVQALAFSSNGRQLAIGHQDGTLTLWDTTNGRRLAQFIRHATPIRSIAFASDGNSLASMSSDGFVKLWDVRMNDQWLAKRKSR